MEVTGKKSAEETVRMVAAENKADILDADFGLDFKISMEDVRNCEKFNPFKCAIAIGVKRVQNATFACILPTTSYILMRVRGKNGGRKTMWRFINGEETRAELSFTDLYKRYRHEALIVLKAPKGPRTLIYSRKRRKAEAERDRLISLGFSDACIYHSRGLDDFVVVNNESEIPKNKVIVGARYHTRNGNYKRGKPRLMNFRSGAGVLNKSYSREELGLEA
jgi:hypothetical protein